MSRPALRMTRILPGSKRMTSPVASTGTTTVSAGVWLKAATGPSPAIISTATANAAGFMRFILPLEEVSTETCPRTSEARPVPCYKVQWDRPEAGLADCSFVQITPDGRIGMLNATLALLLLPAATQAPAAPGEPEKLAALARLYGVVRWFHPTDAAHEVDWNRLAVHAAAAVRSARTTADVQRALQETFAP